LAAQLAAIPDTGVVTMATAKMISRN